MRGKKRPRDLGSASGREASPRNKPEPGPDAEAAAAEKQTRFLRASSSRARGGARLTPCGSARLRRPGVSFLERSHVQGRPSAVDLPKDRLAVGLPDEARGPGVVRGDVLVVRPLEVSDRRETPVADAVPRDLAEEALDEVHPRARRRRVVHAHPRVLREPGPDVRVLVRGVVVQHDVDLDASGDVPVDLPEEREPLFVRVRLVVVVDDPARQIVEGCEERRRAVARVVVRLRADVPDPERQARLRALERLALGLLVAAEDDGVLRRVEVEADDVPELGREVRVLRDLERPREVRLDAVLVPDEAHGVLRDADGPGHRPGAVPRVPLRRARRLRDDPLPLLVRYRRLAPPSRKVRQPADAGCQEPLRPFLHGHAGDAEPLGRLALREAVDSAKDDLRPADGAGASLLRVCHAGKLPADVGRDIDRESQFHAHSISYALIYFNGKVFYDSAH